MTAQTIAESGDDLSVQLVKTNSLVEAQTDFRFDQPARTLVLAVTSTYSTDRYVPELAYDLATGSRRCSALADRELSQEMFVEQCTA